jgi:tetratricopeptide (TPR) repeat protein
VSDLSFRDRHIVDGFAWKSAPIVATMLVLILAAPQVSATENSWQNYFEQGKNKLAEDELALAESSYQQAVKAAEKIPNNTLNLVMCENELANVFTLENKTAMAEAAYSRSLKLLELQYGKKSSKLLKTLFALGSIYEGEGEHNLAAEYYSRAIEINENHFRSFNPAVISNGNRCDLIAGKATGIVLNPGKLKLSEQPSLDASEAMVNSLGNFSEDLIKHNDSSDQDLVSEFQNELSNSPGNAISKSRISLSTGPSKQADIEKHSSAI